MRFNRLSMGRRRQRPAVRWELLSRVLTMEKEIWRHAPQRYDEAQAAGRRKRKAEEASGGFKSGQGDAEGCAPQKPVRPVDRKEAATYLLK